jgi:hypothetical protein
VPFVFAEEARFSASQTGGLFFEVAQLAAPLLAMNQTLFL